MLPKPFSLFDIFRVVLALPWGLFFGWCLGQVAYGMVESWQGILALLIVLAFLFVITLPGTILTIPVYLIIDRWQEHRLEKLPSEKQDHARRMNGMIAKTLWWSLFTGFAMSLASALTTHQVLG